MFLPCYLFFTPKTNYMFNQVLSHINWLHVVVAAIAYFAIGSLWYSPVLFAKKWMTLVKVDFNDPAIKKGMAVTFGGSFVLMLIISFGLAVLLQILPAVNMLGGIKLGLLVGLTISSASISINYLYTKKPFALYLIDCGYHIVGIAVAGAVLSGWQ